MRNPVAAIWVFGLVVALLVYQLGPNHLIATIAAVAAEALRVLERWSYDLSRISAEFVRAAAVGLYVVFVALSLLVIRNGGRARAALILVSGLFYLLVWRNEFDVSEGRWLGGFLLTGIAALIMTHRLTGFARTVRRP